MANDAQRLPVLIVEDDPDTAEALALLLEACGRASILCATREEAVEMLKTQTPCVLVMDYMMPGMSPERFVEHVRHVCPECKIVLMSAIMDIEDIARRLMLDDFFQKPSEMDRLAKYVAELPL